MVSQKRSRKEGSLNYNTKTIITILLLIFIPIVGIILMYIWMKWPKWLKIFITCIPFVIAWVVFESRGLTQKQYTDPDMGVTFTYPGDWIPVKDSGGQITVGSGGAKQIYINSYQLEDKNETPDQYWNSYLTINKQELPGFTLLSSGSANIHGLTYKQYLFTYGKGNKLYEGEIFMTNYNGKIYGISFADDELSFIRDEPSALTIIHSVILR